MGYLRMNIIMKHLVKIIYQAVRKIWDRVMGKEVMEMIIRRQKVIIIAIVGKIIGRMMHMSILTSHLLILRKILLEIIVFSKVCNSPKIISLSPATQIKTLAEEVLIRIQELLSLVHILQNHNQSSKGIKLKHQEQDKSNFNIIMISKSEASRKSIDKIKSISLNMTLQSFDHAEFVVENSIQIVLANMRQIAKKFSRRNEKNSIPNSKE